MEETLEEVILSKPNPKNKNNTQKPRRPGNNPPNPFLIGINEE